MTITQTIDFSGRIGELRLISVIIPAYNCENTLKRTIESIIDSGLINYEIIIVNDGSTDNTVSVCNDLCSQYSFIKYIEQPNCGVSATRNRGVEEAVGKYLLFVDSDDLLEKIDMPKIEKLIEDDTDLIIFGMKFVYLADETVVKEEIKSFEEHLKINQKDFMDNFEALFHSNYLSSYCNKLVKKDLFVSNGIKFDVELTNYEDLSAVLQTLCFANTIAILSEPYYIYLIDYYNDRTYDRINIIEDVVKNTDLIAKVFLGYEKMIMQKYNVTVPGLKNIVLGIYFDLLFCKLTTIGYSEIRFLCKSFVDNFYINECIGELRNQCRRNKLLYSLMKKEKTFLIKLLVLYAKTRNYISIRKKK